MRVLHVQKVKGIGGSERHLLSLLPGLDAAGVEVRMWAAITDSGGRFVEALQERGVGVAEVAAGGLVNPGLARTLGTELRRFKPDLVHTHLVHGDLYGQLVARAQSIPAVSSFHGAHRFFRREPVRTAERIAGRFARQTIAISEYVRGFLLQSRLRPAGRIRVVPYGVDARDWAFVPDERAHERARLGLSSSDVAVGIASRLIPGKGHDLLLPAFAEARAQASGLRLLIAGDGPLRSEVEAASRQLGSNAATVLGYVDDIRSFMASCDILVFPTLPSLGEGFGLAALEAMAAGRPVIATRVASLPEVVADGETGVLVPPDDPRPLADALVGLAANEQLRAGMGEAGRRRASERFDLRRMIASTLSVYRDSVA
jgi:glycosyltransferase involved in cell wall biosynthesis